MNILSVYEKYHIPKNLEQHQFAVAGCAYQICESLNNFQETHEVLSACLLHDMGSIIKFDFSLFPDVYAQEGLSYWQEIKEEFIRKYGPDEHVATLEIAKELNVSRRVVELTNSVGFSKAVLNLNSQDLSAKICCYVDQRVSPFGVKKLFDRIMEGYERKKTNPKFIQSNQEKFQEYVSALMKMEEQIFSNTNLTPDDVNDLSISPYLEKLKNFTL